MVNALHLHFLGNAVGQMAGRFDSEPP